MARRGHFRNSSPSGRSAGRPPAPQQRRQVKRLPSCANRGMSCSQSWSGAGGSGMTRSAAPAHARKSRCRSKRNPARNTCWSSSTPPARSPSIAAPRSRRSPRRGGRGKKAVRKGKAKSVIEFRAPIAALRPSGCSARRVRRSLAGHRRRDRRPGRRGHRRDGRRPRGSRHMARARPRAGALSGHAAGSTRRTARARRSPDGRRWSRPAVPPWHILHDPFGVRQTLPIRHSSRASKIATATPSTASITSPSASRPRRMRTSSSPCCRSGAL